MTTSKRTCINLYSSSILNPIGPLPVANTLSLGPPILCAVVPMGFGSSSTGESFWKSSH